MSLSFADRVRADLGSDTPDPDLRLSDSLEQWKRELLKVVQGVDSQIPQREGKLELLELECSNGRRAEYLKAKAEFKQWKGGALYVKSLANARLNEAKNLIRQHNIETSDNEVRANYARLRTAVYRHRETVLQDYDPSEADLALWGVLDDMTTESYRGRVG